jgi:hypothetical protein
MSSRGAEDCFGNIVSRGEELDDRLLSKQTKRSASLAHGNHELYHGG